MELSALLLTTVGAMLACVTGLFGWLLRSANAVGRTQAGLAAEQASLSRTLGQVVQRIDALVVKLEHNFSIQVSEQLLRNTLQEKVANLERQLAENLRTLQRANITPRRVGGLTDTDDD